MLPSHCSPASSVKATWHILGRGWTFDLGVSSILGPILYGSDVDHATKLHRSPGIAVFLLRAPAERVLARRLKKRLSHEVATIVYPLLYRVNQSCISHA